MTALHCFETNVYLVKNVSVSVKKIIFKGSKWPKQEVIICFLYVTTWGRGTLSPIREAQKCAVVIFPSTDFTTSRAHAHAFA